MNRAAAARIAVGPVARSLAAARAPAAGLGVDKIVVQHVKARGGLDAWRAVRAMVWVGHVESAHVPDPNVQFVLQQERPNEARFERTAQGQQAVRGFDGARGGKARAGRDGRPQVQTYTRDEIRYAQRAHCIDGPLIGHDARGNRAALEALERIEGRQAYRLELKRVTGESERRWMDAETFLKVRSGRTAKGTGTEPSRTVATVCRNFKSCDRLQIRTVVDTGTATAGAAPDRMVIERVVVSPPIDQRAFEDPAAPHIRKALDDTPRRESALSPTASAPPAGTPPAADSQNAASPPR